MSVSYVSKVLQPLQYITPVDPNVAYKGLLHQQQNFDKGLAQVEARLDQLGKYDILHPEHRAYYQQKKADIDAQVEKYTGANFADHNVLAQIGQLTASLDQDERIVGAIADTRTLRGVQAQYQKWADDPKKYKDQYAAQNEWDFNRQLGEYMGNKATTARYQGDKTANPYFNYDAEFGKELDAMTKRILASPNDTSVVDGYVTENRKLTYDQVQQIARTRLASDPRFSRQVGVDARYKGQAILANPDAYRTEYGRQLRAQIDTDTKVLSANQSEWAARLARASSAEQKKELEAARDNALTYQRNLVAGKQHTLDGLSTMDPTAMAVNSFTENYLNHLAGRYTFDASKLRSDPTYIAAQAHNLAVSKFDWDQKSWKAEFDSDEFWKKTQFGADRSDKEWEHQYKEKELAQQASTVGLKKQKDGSYASAGTDLFAVDLPVGPDGLNAPTLESVQSDLDGQARTQDAAVRDMAVNIVRWAGNADLADKMARQMNVDYYGDGQIKATRTGAIPPAIAKLVVDWQNDYNQYLKHGKTDPEFLKRLTPELRKQYGDITERAAQLKLQREEIKQVQQNARTRSGLTAGEIAEYNQLDRGFKAGTYDWKLPTSIGGPLGGGAAMDTPEAVRYRQLSARYNNPQWVNEELTKRGYIQHGLVAGGDYLKADNEVNQALLYRVREGSIAPAGNSRSEQKDLIEKWSGGAPVDVVGVTFIPHSRQVDVRLKTGSGKEALEETVRLDYGNSAEFGRMVDSRLLKAAQTAPDPFQQRLDSQGSLLIGNNRHLYTPSQGLAVGVSPTKNRDGSYGLTYRYGEHDYPVPTDFLDKEQFQGAPVEWCRSGLDAWASRIQAVCKQYFGKNDPNYIPTVADLHRLSEQYRLKTSTR